MTPFSRVRAKSSLQPRVDDLLKIGPMRKHPEVQTPQRYDKGRQDKMKQHLH